MHLPTLLHDAVAQLAVEIDCRVKQHHNLASVDERTLRWELACCILSSQVPYRIAVAVADCLRERGALDDISKTPTDLQADLETILCSDIEVGSSSIRYRFPFAKAQQLANALVAFRGRYGTLQEFVASVREPDVARRWLIDEVPGLGPKQASMFLRNSGVSYNLAILDRHVIQFMELQQLRPATSARPTGLVGYEAHEHSLRAYAATLGFDLGVIDWSIWFVMRAAKSLRYCE